nr:E3 ubiquitin-protein ligase pellino homolog 1 isoform X3 [Rattus norvegicus]
MGDYGNSPRPNLVAHAQRRASGRLLHNRCFPPSENYSFQEPSRHHLPMWPCPLPLCPALLLVPVPPSQCVSVTQRRFEVEGRSGAPPPPSPAPAAAAAAAAAVRRHWICLQPGELTTKRARASLSSALIRARLRVPLGLAGLGSWREGCRLRRYLRSTGACAAPASRVSARRAELAFRPPAVVRLKDHCGGGGRKTVSETSGPDRADALMNSSQMQLSAQEQASQHSNVEGPEPLDLEGY